MGPPRAMIQIYIFKLETPYSLQYCLSQGFMHAIFQHPSAESLYLLLLPTPSLYEGFVEQSNDSWPIRITWRVKEKKILIK